MSISGDGKTPQPQQAQDSESQAAPAASPGTSYSRHPLRGAPITPGMKALFFWNQVAPFFVSAALFLSRFFFIFAPLPFLILGVTRHWAWLVVAAVTNSAI